MLKKEQHQWLSKLSTISHPTPFMVTDLQIIRENIETLENHLPKVDLYYAIKSNSSEKIIQTIDSKLKGYDIASLGELKHLMRLGVKTNRMLYSNPVKVPTHIQEAFKLGVKYFAFDSLDEIKKLAEYAPGSNVYLRIKVSDYGSKFPLSSKFGVDALHAVAYMDTALEAGLNPCGITFHVGSQSESPHTWVSAFETAGHVISKLSNAGIPVDFVDIGGGIPASYTERITSISQLARTINNSISKYIPENVRVVAEPGRFVSASGSVIVSSVIGREFRGSSEWIFLDMGVFQGLMEPLEINSWRYPVFTSHGKRAAAFSRPFVLTGPTCDAYDTIGLVYMLPSTLGIGDRVYIGAAGAYTTVYSSNFNGFEPPTQYFLNDQ